MNLSEIADVLRGRANLRQIEPSQINSWAKDAGEQLASADVTRSYFLAIVEQISRVLSECRAATAKSRSDTPNYEDLIFLEPHIAYQAGRKKGNEKKALLGLKQVLSDSLALISRPEEDNYLLENITRLNQFFQAIAGYYTAKKEQEAS